MTFQILLPKLGFSMEEGTLAEWLAKDGDTVTEGAPLFLLESEKSANEVEAPASGVLKIIVEPSDEVLPVGTILGEIA